MKKFLIFLILFTSMFILGNAEAEELNFNMNDYRNDFEFPDKMTELGTYENNYNRAYQYYLDNCQGVYDSYIIDKNGYGYGWGENQINLICFNQSDNDWTPSVEIGYWNNYGNRFKLQLAIYKTKGNNDYLVRHFYNTSNSTGYSYEKFSFTFYNYLNLKSGTFDKVDNGIIDTNIDFKFSSERQILDTDYQIITSFTNNNITYENNDVIYENGSSVSNKPTITFTKTDNTETINNQELVTSSDVNLKFSIIDNTKYIYQYRIEPSEDWTTLTLTSTDNIDINLTSNTSITARVLDVETHDVISTSTYTVTSISNIDVTINITKINDNNCIANYNNTQVETCVNLNIEFNYINFNKYIYQYSINNGTTFINIENNQIVNRIFNYKLNEEYLIVKILDKTTRNELAYETYTFSKHDEKPKEPYINFEIFYNLDMCSLNNDHCDTYELMNPEAFDKINKNEVIIKNMSATLGIKIYNFNPNYHYYYSNNAGDYREFTIEDLHLSEYGYYYTAIETDFNISVTIDIYDENNNYIKSATYTITKIIEEEIDLDNILDRFQEMFKNDNNIFEHFKTIYEELRKSRIGSFIFLTIITSLILLIMNSLQR